MRNETASATLHEHPSFLEGAATLPDIPELPELPDYLMLNQPQPQASHQPANENSYGEPDITEEELQGLALSGCKSPALIHCMRRAWSYEATVSAMYVSEAQMMLDNLQDTIATLPLPASEQLADLLAGSECLFMEFLNPISHDKLPRIALIFCELNCVAIFETQVDGSIYEAETGGLLTRGAFWDYMDTLPNLKKHLDIYNPDTQDHELANSEVVENLTSY